MKIGVSSYSYNHAIMAGQMTIYDVVDTAAKQGFESLDFAVLPDNEPLCEMAKKLAKRTRDAGISVKNYAVSADFLKNDLDKEVERLKGELEIAATLGAKTFRHDTTWSNIYKLGYRTLEKALPRIAEGVRAVTEYGQTLGIRTMVENHGQLMQDSERMERLVSMVDHDNFGLLVDMGNFMCADEDPAKAVGRVAPFAFHVHAKDFLYKPVTAADPGEAWFGTRAGAYLRGTVVGHGVVPVEACLRKLRDAGYDDEVAIEFEGMEPCVEALRVGRDNVLKVMKELGVRS